MHVGKGYLGCVLKMIKEKITKYILSHSLKVPLVLMVFILDMDAHPVFY